VFASVADGRRSHFSRNRGDSRRLGARELVSVRRLPRAGSGWRGRGRFLVARSGLRSGQRIRGPPGSEDPRAELAPAIAIAFRTLPRGRETSQTRASRFRLRRVRALNSQANSARSRASGLPDLSGNRRFSRSTGVHVQRGMPPSPRNISTFRRCPESPRRQPTQRVRSSQS